MTADQCRGCPFPDQTAALELVRLREGIRRLAEDMDRRARQLSQRAVGDNVYARMDRREAGTWELAADHLRALLDDLLEEDK